MYSNENTQKIKYKFLDLGTFGGTYSQANAINNAGQIIGTDTERVEVPEIADRVFSNSYAVVWDNSYYVPKTTKITDAISKAYAINNVGGVAGDRAVIVDGRYTTQNVVWQNGETRVLNSLNNSYGFDSINGINDQGIVVGSSFVGDLGTKLHAVMWNETGVIDLGGLNGLETLYSQAADINAAGTIAGSSTLSSSNEGMRAVIWQEGKIIDLSEGYSSAALSINNHGVVAGFAQTEQYKFHATVWADNKMIVLQDTPGSYSSVKSINNKNQMVGSEFGGAQGAHALLWNSFHSAPIDLNQFLDQFLIDEGWVLTEAKDINDHGYIVGTAKNSKTNQEHAFLLSPEDLKGLSNLMPTTPAAEVGDYNQHHGLQASQIVVTGNPTNNNPSPDAWAFGF